MSSRSASVRSVAAEIVDWALETHQPLATHLRALETNLSSRDRRLLRELALGTLRWLRRLDSVLEIASSRKLSAIDASLRSPLRVALYQLLFLDRIPAHAAVDEAVKEARRRSHRGGAGFVNAVLRRVARSPSLDSWPVEESDLIPRLAIETSHPEWLIRRWYQGFGEDRVRGLLDSNNRPKPWQILTFRGHGGPEGTAALLAEEGIETVPSDLAPMGLVVTEGDPLESHAFRDGLFYLQDVASQAAALIPTPGPGERVVDLAAAPGGKSFSLLSSCSDLEVTAADRSFGRLMTLKENCDRLNLEIRLIQADGFSPPLQEAADRVVVDLPCSGTGTLRKHPELKWRVQPDEIHRLSRQGLELVQAAGRLVRPGGILSVVTCSIEPEENSQLISEFLGGQTEYELLPLEGELAGSLEGWIVGPGQWQVLPADVHDGFTVHAMRRNR